MCFFSSYRALINTALISEKKNEKYLLSGGISFKSNIAGRTDYTANVNPARYSTTPFLAC